MKRVLALACIVLAGLAGGMYFGYIPTQNQCVCGSMCACAGSDKVAEAKSAMRKLWEDHITYTRNFIISALANLEDKDAVAQRLLQNQDDIGNAIKPFYGAQAGKALADLLREHITVAVDVVSAAKSGDDNKLKESQALWFANADKIADFLSKANPHLPHHVLKDMLYKHLELTTGEVVSRLKKDWVADISFYDKGHEHMLMFSDALIDGIAKQFPDKFQQH